MRILNKGGIFILYERILAEQQQLTSQIESLKEAIQKFPDGKLYCTRNDNRYKWYRTDGKSHIYIPKQDRKLAEQLAAKKYYSALLNDLTQRKRAIDFYLRHYPKVPETAEKLLTESPAYQELLSPHFKTFSQDLLEWETSSFDRNTYMPEQLIIKASSGNYVRSKSEALIDMILYTNHIPFRYECALRLGEAVIYPDFTIRHPETGKIYYWEHFGLMDNPGYRQKTGTKLQQYINHGIIPTVQLITTYETLKKPLSAETIEQIVKEYFL